MEIVNKTHRFVLRRFAFLPGILLGLAAASLTAQANPVTADTWFSTLSAGTATDDGLQFDITASGAQHIVTYFDRVNLNEIGSSLKLSLTFSGTLGSNSNSSQWPLGFGLFDSTGALSNVTDNRHVSASGLGASGGTSPSIYSNYSGYVVRMLTQKPYGGDPDVAARQLFRLYDRDPVRYAGNLVNGGYGGGDVDANAPLWTGGPGRDDIVAFQSDTPYSLTYTITRTDADTLSFSFAITGGNLPGVYNFEYSLSSEGKDADWISRYFHTEYDSFALTLQSGSGTFTGITIHSMETSYAIPEPATVTLLMGAGALAFAGFRKYRRR